MEEWLKTLWHRSRHTKFGLAVLFLVVLVASLTTVALVSDIGFAEEARKHRVGILEISLIGAGVFIFISSYLRTVRGKNSFKQAAINLESTVNDLEQQKESAFRLMERYKEEAQEDIVNRLIQLATFSLKLPDWQAKGAKIERFRLEETSVNKDLDIELNIAERRV